MKRNYGGYYISENINLFNNIEKILDYKQFTPKEVKKELETESLQNIRTIERGIKESTGYGPSEYIKRRALTKLIQDMYKDGKVTETKIRKHHYKNKYTVNKLCISYFNVEIDEAVKNIDKYKLQEKPTKEHIYCKYILGKINSSKRVLTGSNLNRGEVETVKVRFMGRSGGLIANDGDKISLYSFTKDTSSKFIDCKVDYNIFLRESEIKEKIDFMYEKYKASNKEIDYKYLNKIKSFRHEDIMTLGIVDNEIVFYKSMLLELNEAI